MSNSNETGRDLAVPGAMLAIALAILIYGILAAPLLTLAVILTLLLVPFIIILFVSLLASPGKKREK